MSCPQLVEPESKPETVSLPQPYNIFEDLEVFARFEHYRSESYAQAIHLMASQTSLHSDSRQSYASCVTTLRELSLSQSAPSSPKGIHAQEKSSTLPSTSSRLVPFPSPKKSSSLSLSSFFRKLSPRFYKNSRSKSKPWIVVEFSEKDIEGHAMDQESLANGDQSLELALQGKERYMAALASQRSSKGAVRHSFAGGSQPSLEAWVRAGRPKLFGPIHQRPSSACPEVPKKAFISSMQSDSDWSLFPNAPSKQAGAAWLPAHNVVPSAACHSVGPLTPVVVVDRPGRASLLLDRNRMEQVLAWLGNEHRGTAPEPVQ